MIGTLAVVGDSMLDRDLVGHARRLCPDAPAPVLENPVERARPGGAGLAALLAARQGRRVSLVTALAADDAGNRLRQLLANHGVTVIDLGADHPTTEKIRIGTGRQVLVRLDQGASSPKLGPLTEQARAVLADSAAVLVSDYGRGLTAHPAVRALLARSEHGAGRQLMVWDPHPRGMPPVAGAHLLTPNRAEAGLDPGASLREVTAAGRRMAADARATAVAVTLGCDGAVLVTGTQEPPLVVAPSRSSLGDPCGAGDSFASTAASALADGAVLSEAVMEAVEAAAAFVAQGGASGICVDGPSVAPLLPTHPPARHDNRASTVVATGGCFDILHAGHLSLLQAARALGDRLVVCLNSDRSVRRLKGPGRPLQPEQDRRALLLALACVDAVEIFDDDTPIPLLRRLRPGIFVKGADYSAATLPEASVLAEWGGQAVVVPCVSGRSTTHVLEEAIRHARICS